MNCPKCGFDSPEGTLECPRCGIVFSRYKTAAVPGLARPAPAAGAMAGAPGAAKRPADQTTGQVFSGPAPGWQPRREEPAARPAPPVDPAAGQVYAGPEPDWKPWREELPVDPADGQVYDGPVPGVGGAVAGGDKGVAGRGAARSGADAAGKPASGAGGPATGTGGSPWAVVGGPAVGSEPRPHGDPAAVTLYGGGAVPGDDEPAVVGMAMRPSPAGGPRAGGASGFTAVPAFSVGGVLRDTFSIFFHNLLPFLLISAAVVAPLLFGLAIAASALRGRAALIAAALVLVGSGLLTTPLATGAITFGVAQELRGREATIGDCLRRGLRSLWRVFAVALLQGFAVFGGFLLCAVPGLIALVVLSVAVPAALEEGLGVLAALGRSVDLTRDRWASVLGVLLVLGVIQFALTSAMNLIAPSVAGGPLLGQTLPALAVSMVTTCLDATAAAVLYYRLRSVSEAVDVAGLPSVFD